MTQVKKSDSPIKAKGKLSKTRIAAQKLAQDYISLSSDQKSLVTDFFNLHNAAVNLYNLMADETRKICDAYIIASEKVNKVQ